MCTDVSLSNKFSPTSKAIKENLSKLIKVNLRGTYSFIRRKFMIMIPFKSAALHWFNYGTCLYLWYQHFPLLFLLDEIYITLHLSMFEFASNLSPNLSVNSTIYSPDNLRTFVSWTSRQVTQTTRNLIRPFPGRKSRSFPWEVWNRWPPAGTYLKYPRCPSRRRRRVRFPGSYMRWTLITLKLNYYIGVGWRISAIGYILLPIRC